VFSKANSLNSKANMFSASKYVDPPTKTVLASGLITQAIVSVAVLIIAASIPLFATLLILLVGLSPLFVEIVKVAPAAE
jgi:hypothetical protein